MNAEVEANHQNINKIDPLDLEFKKILCVIRKHIPYINNNQYLNQCRIWLEKLSECNGDKVQRNLYLAELARQIQKNKLTPPFHQPPPVGGLKTFNGNFKVPKLHKIKEETENRPSTIVPQNTPNVDEFADLVQPMQSEDEEFCLEYLKIIDIPTKLPTYKENARSNEVNVDIEEFQIENTDLDSHHCAGEPHLTTRIEEEISKNDLKVDQNKSIDNNVEIDDSSWADLSETGSSECMFQKDSSINDNTKKIFLQNNVESVHRKRRRLRNRGPELVERLSDQFLSEPEMLEIMYPKTKILKDTNYISEDWKNTIEALQLRLSEMIHQNRELKGTIKRMELQMEENAKKYEADLSRKLKSADEQWLKEINQIKEIHADNIFDLERSFRNKIEEHNLGHEHRYDKLLEDCEKRITEAKCEKDCVIQQKEDEIKRLTDIVQQQCVRITEEITNLQSQISSCSCEEKMNLLRKCIGKMEKLFHRSEKEHLRQIEKLRQELEIKESTLQIQLKTQKAELLTKTSSERQEEFEHIVNSLEVKYIQMLEMHEIQVMAVKQESNEKIERLIELLMKNGVPFDQIDV